MKRTWITSILIMSFGLISSLAMAASWNFYLNNPNYDVYMPQIQFERTSVRIDNVCVDGDQLRTIKDVSKCAVALDWEEGSLCQKYETAQLTRPISQKTSICAHYLEWGGGSICQEWKTVERSVPLIYNVSIYRVLIESEGVETFALSKNFYLPDCYSMQRR